MGRLVEVIPHTKGLAVKYSPDWGWVVLKKAIWSFRLRLHSGVTTGASKERSLGAQFFGRAVGLRPGWFMARLNRLR